MPVTSQTAPSASARPACSSIRRRTGVDGGECDGRIVRRHRGNPGPGPMAGPAGISHHCGGSAIEARTVAGVCGSCNSRRPFPARATRLYRGDNTCHRADQHEGDGGDPHRRRRFMGAVRCSGFLPGWPSRAQNLRQYTIRPDPLSERHPGPSGREMLRSLRS